MNRNARKIFEDGVDIKEELQEEEVINAGITEEFELFFEKKRHSKRSFTTLPETVSRVVFGADNLDDSPQQVAAIVEYITGPEVSWCNNSVEVHEFRQAITAVFLQEWSEFSAAHPNVSMSHALRSLPQRFCLPPLQKAQLDMITKLCPSKVSSGFGFVLLRVRYNDLSGCRCQTVREFPLETIADEAVRVTMERVFSVTNYENTSTETDENGSPKHAPVSYVFQVQGRSEFVYGKEPLINFRYIRDCAVKQLDVNLSIEPCISSLLHGPRFEPHYGLLSDPREGPGELEASRSQPSDFGLQTSLWSVREKLTIRFPDGLNNVALCSELMKRELIREGDDVYVAVVVEVYFGTTPCCAPQVTPWRVCHGISSSPSADGAAGVRWSGDAKLLFDLEVCDIPREAKLCLSVVGTTPDRYTVVAAMSASQLLSRAEERLNVKKGEEQLSPVFFLGCASTQLFGHWARKCWGELDVRFWSGDEKANPIGSNSMSPDTKAISTRVELPAFARPVALPRGVPPERMRQQMLAQHADDFLHLDNYLRDSTIEQLRQLKRVLATDPLYTLTAADKVLLWKYRETLLSRPKALCKFLLAVNWLLPYAVYEAHRLMKLWAPLHPLDALELLDARYADTKVREHAIECMKRMSDYELKGCILQLVQVLKYEPYHYSAVGRFLLRRSVASPHVIGHYVFWYLAAEMSNSRICERHGLLLEELLRRLPQRIDLVRQMYVADLLLQTAMKVKDAAKKDRVDTLRTHLRSLKLPSRFTLALNPAMECRDLDIGKCKVMDSKKFPLYLVFHNAQEDGDPLYVIFKAGDDLRQDLLTLQLLELMDAVWKVHGLDLHIIPYGCISTGEGVGMIEIVLNSDTVANITRKDGGAQAAFSEEPLMNWLRQHNRERQDVERCLWNFVYSAAGYAVATYVLGIGDRHNDNIMLRQDGTLFHIDFGHFLGNFKTKFGIKRETAPFIFTPMYAYMLGGTSSPIYAHFVDIACHAYNIIRRRSNILVILFMLMLSTGIPELQRVEDIGWLRTVLLLGRSDEEASEHYRSLINVAINNIRTLINDYIHIMAH